VVILESGSANPIYDKIYDNEMDFKETARKIQKCQDSIFSPLARLFVTERLDSASNFAQDFFFPLASQAEPRSLISIGLAIVDIATLIFRLITLVFRSLFPANLATDRFQKMLKELDPKMKINSELPEVLYFVNEQRQENRSIYLNTSFMIQRFHIKYRAPYEYYLSRNYCFLSSECEPKAKRPAPVYKARENKADLLRLFNLEPSATKNNLEKAFRKSAFPLHPDKQTGKSREEKKAAEAKFKDLVNARDTLLEILD
jgi:hypothetical protein